MPVVTGYTVVDDEGLRVAAHPHGNNVAFRCGGCGGPVLAVIRAHQLGSAPEAPTHCPDCGSSYWVQRVEEQEQLVVHRLR